MQDGGEGEKLDYFDYLALDQANEKSKGLRGMHEISSEGKWGGGFKRPSRDA